MQHHHHGSTKTTFLTIALELRNKIYAYALEVPEEFQVCECPEIFSNELGLCDLIKRPIKYDPSQECHPSRTPDNPKTLLNMICKQTADELKDIHVQFPILVFCAAKCAGKFMRSLRISLRHCTWSLPYRRYIISRLKILGREDQNLCRCEVRCRRYDHVERDDGFE